MNILHKAPFIDRFGATRSKLRAAEIWQAVCRIALASGCSLVLLAAADYWLELPWPARAASLGLLVCGTLAAVGLAVLRLLRWWSTPRTAVEIESRFPQLGQRVRTTVQYAGVGEAALTAEGVAPELFTALEHDIEVQARPLDLSTIISRRRLAAAAVLAVIPLTLLAIGNLANREWRLATQRVLLNDAPYTRLTVRPGDVTIRQGQDLTIALELTGRVDRPVSIEYRPHGTGASWKVARLPAAGARRLAASRVQYEGVLEKLARPTEYRVMAGGVRSELYVARLLYPLAVRKFDVTVTPPAYTGVEPSTIGGGDVEVVEGTRCTFQVELDRPCARAFVVLQQQAGQAPQPIRMEVDGSRLRAVLEFDADQTYWLAAQAADGGWLPEEHYLVRVRRDQPPRIAFETPEDPLEVHPLAEIMLRCRVRDDFGLTRCGIVFQLSDGQERTLATGDFSATEHGRTAQAVLGELLPLEEFALSPRESVAYYAFAEDNFPGGSRRIETDLRFIDIRPFKLVYKQGGT